MTVGQREGRVVLHVHRAERADRLADALAAMLSVAPEDPFAPEVVAVPARGVERWLVQRLSHALGAAPGRSDGVCAHVRFPSAAGLVEQAVLAGSAAGDGVADAHADPGADPWRPERLAWSLLDVLDAADGRDSPAPELADRGDEPGRRFRTATRIAARFAAYGVDRPAMLRAWAVGNDVDGAGSALHADLCWQPELWRRLRHRIGSPSPAERLPEVCAALRDRPAAVDLPDRLSCFGLTRLPAASLAVLAALADHRDVHLWLPHPSPALWERVAAAVPKGPAPRRRQDSTAELAANPVVAALGRDCRELQLVLAGGDAEPVDSYHGAGRADDGAPSLLRLLQRDLSADRVPPGPGDGAAGDRRPVLDDADRSLAVHACHGPARQVEVLRDVLLGLLAADASLEPRDILVMCPDIESYAPLLSTAFGLSGASGGAAGEVDGHPGHLLRVRLADRALRQTNPLLATVSALLDLADARLTAPQVLDFAAAPPVRRRFRFDDDDLERIRDWTASAGVRWGLDAAARARYRLQHVAQNTWRAGLDRILLGVAMSEDDGDYLGLALPLDDVDSSDVDLAGRLAELLDRLGEVLRTLSGEQPLSAWLGALLAGLDLLTAVGTGEDWQRAQAEAELAELAADAGNRASEVRLSLGDVRAALADRLAGRPTRANFRTGALTVCTLVPMRSVPHRVVCLLGLDDGRFPRQTVDDGEDILAWDPVAGERDRRSEDRQLFLDALCAAEESFLVFYSGADERTNAERPPAVPVGELLDAVADTVRTADGGPVRDRVVVRHPLQPFDPRNFAAGALGAPGPLSFDRTALAGARALALTRMPAEPMLRGPLPPPAGADTVDLAELTEFLVHPVRGFLRQRLGVALAGDGSDLAGGLRADLDPLTRWAVGERMLQARRSGLTAEACRQAEWRRGALPPGTLGSAVLDGIAPEVEQLLEAAGAHQALPGEYVDVAVTLPDGSTVRGAVGDVHGGTLLHVGFARLRSPHRLRAWTGLLAVSAATGAAATAISVGRGPKTGVLRSTLRTEPAAALRVLDDLVALYRTGLCEPLPLPPAASYTYAHARYSRRDAEAAEQDARVKYADHRGGDVEDPYLQVVWGPQPAFDRLLLPAAPGAEEPTRFGVLARRLWQPMLAAETTDTA